jgi:hypothetical protein
MTPIREPGETLGMFKSSTDLKKAFNIRVNNGEVYPLRREMVYCFFDIPAAEAARIMRVSLSLLKKIRSWVNVDRWPCLQLHCEEFEGLTLTQVIEGRNEVISGLEKEFLERPSRHLSLALTIMKELRQYAPVYACLINPEAGRRPATKKSDAGKDKKESRVGEPSNESSGDRVKEIMESMQPRQVVKRKTKVSVVTTVEPEDSGCFWPVCITQEFNFNQLFESDDFEDELKLGPLTLASVSTSVSVDCASGGNACDGFGAL